MRQSVRKFLSNLRDYPLDEEISDEWEKLTPRERIEAISLANTLETELIIGREESFDEEEALLVA